MLRVLAISRDSDSTTLKKIRLSSTKKEVSNGRSRTSNTNTKYQIKIFSFEEEAS